jgi:hypothetical protein
VSTEWLRLLPPWLLAGVGLGLVVVLVIVGIFVAGDRLFPTPPTDRRRRVDGTDRRRAEIRTYLETIDERFVEDASVHGQTVAFHLPERAVAITFDPQAYFAIDGTGTHAVLCEHEMPGSALGRRLPFDVSATGTDPRSPTDGDSIGAAFSRLGLTPTADADEVRTAYRRRVKNVHPDQGGDSESFRRLREAYTTAKEHAD